MKQMRGFVYKLKPIASQERKFRQYAGVCRLVYNLALEQRAIWGKSHGCNFYTAASDLKDLRAEFDFVREVSQTAQTQALRDLDTAFKNFYARRSGFPSPRKKKLNDTFRFVGREVHVRKVSRRWSEVRLPKIGWVKFRDTRPLRGEIRNATISLTPLGWHISIMCQYEIDDPTPIDRCVGIDRGVVVPMMLSDGTSYTLPASMVSGNKLHRRVQRMTSRRKRGSKRWLKSVRRASKLKAKEARIRVHWQHEVTTAIAQNYGYVAMEALKTKNMTRSARGSLDEPGRMVKQKSGLNRVILNIGWFGLQQKLKYKLESQGGLLTLVNPAYTSQTCSKCKIVDKEGRKNQASFVCPSCGFACNADLNAAININNRGNTAVLGVEAHGYTAREALTTSVAA